MLKKLVRIEFDGVTTDPNDRSDGDGEDIDVLEVVLGNEVHAVDDDEGDANGNERLAVHTDVVDVGNAAIEGDVFVVSVVFEVDDVVLDTVHETTDVDVGNVVDVCTNVVAVVLFGTKLFISLGVKEFGKPFNSSSIEVDIITFFSTRL